MNIKNDEGERIIINEKVNLYNVAECIETRQTVKINGKTMTVNEFKKNKNRDPKEGYWSRKAKYEIGENTYGID